MSQIHTGGFNFRPWLRFYGVPSMSIIIPSIKLENIFCPMNENCFLPFSDIAKMVYMWHSKDLDHGQVKLWSEFTSLILYCQFVLMRLFIK